MNYKLDPKIKEIIEPSFISKIELELSNYRENKSKLSVETLSYKNSKSSSLSDEIDKMWRLKLKEYANILETKAVSIDSLISGNKPKEEFSDFNKKYFINYLKSSMVYAIKSREKFDKSFETNYGNFYKNQELSELLLKPLNIPEFVSTLRENISIKDIEYFTENIINQLVCMYPEHELLIKKDKTLDESLYSGLSSFCLKEGFIGLFNAKVTGCIISKSL
ncbi:MAG: hypothetical protein PHN56_02920, partial [Candidatus Nanoarchaeia archaeon]|nr:hypothetical protein [Candidatus Nanoarchaeia archaeon]